MSESLPPSEQPEQPEQPSEQPAEQPAKPARKGLGGVVPRGTGARWAVAVGAAAVIVGGGATAVAVAGHHHGHADRARHLVRPEPGRPHAPEGGHKAEPKIRDGAGPARGGLAKHAPARGQAPAPLPALPIGQAAEKAAAAVEGGKVEGLRAVAQQGGGSAWRAVVLGPDGVRHAVTVSGSDGTITANTPLNGARGTAAR
ncbi:hypothetical protein ACQKM2_17655 [Streptomyces sp. NPDC004126]|uniref:hypothetical protein n=1 Tax=Streptomyces sp. NPDC004126 TaxID=3390695 RepID=UPI003D02B019